MDTIAANEYWLSEFVTEDEDWLSSYLNSIPPIAEEINGNGKCSTFSPYTPITGGPSTPSSAQQTNSTEQNVERVPFNKRWELLKPKIERLYLKERNSLRRVVEIMKE